MKVKKTGSLNYLILEILEKSVDGLCKFTDFAYNPGIYAYYGGRQVKKSDLARAIHRLKQQGLIEKTSINNELVIKLIHSPKNLPEDFNEDIEWDKKWRIVIFDIPEEKRLVRNLFRKNLKKWGFTQLQKSVWMSKRNIYDHLSSYIKELNIEEWVIVIETAKISKIFQ